MSEKRESSRVKDANKRRVMDEEARKRRIRKQLELLEQDNFHEDPHANLVVNKNVPKFEDTMENKRKRKLKTEPFKQRCRKNFTALLEDEMMHFNKKDVNFLSARVPPSRYPKRHFCSVCGFDSNFTCVQCGTRFCSIRCQDIHKETRCMKFTS